MSERKLVSLVVSAMIVLIVFLNLKRDCSSRPETPEEKVLKEIRTNIRRVKLPSVQVVTEDTGEVDTGFEPSEEAFRTKTDYGRVIKMCLILDEDGTNLAGCLEQPNLSSIDEDETIALLNEWIRTHYREVENRCAENESCLQGFSIDD